MELVICHKKTGQRKWWRHSQGSSISRQPHYDLKKATFLIINFCHYSFSSAYMQIL
ncbi:hypothetical protein M758_7G049900 [Ceratodon purpureus]|nr:hypothetical protein M758_7G049900 [Ceratodon purpureus]